MLALASGPPGFGAEVSALHLPVSAHKAGRKSLQANSKSQTDPSTVSFHSTVSG
jgi:hypothetical protein